MAVDVLSHPFRFAPNGVAATVEQDTAGQYAEMLAALCMTRLGERPLVPAFGTPDPVFDTIELADLQAAVAVFGPPVTVNDVSIDVIDAATQQITVQFDDTAGGVET